MKTNHESVQRSLLLRVPSMLWVLIAAIVNNTCCAEIAESRSLPAPTVQKFPRELRRTRADDDSDWYYLYFLTVLPGGKWCVAAIDHFYEPKNLKRKDWNMYSGNSDAMGWVAIEIGTGRVAYLAVPQGDQSQSIRVWPEGLQGWRTGTCAVEVGYAQRDKEVDNAGSDPVEERFLWEWNPADSKVTLLGKAVPVGSLVRALNGSDYVASWSERDADPWNGRVRLRSTTTGESQPFRCRNADLWAKRLRKRYLAERKSRDENAGALDMGSAPHGHAWSSDEVFGPTSDRHSVIGVWRYPPQYPVISIRRINLAAKGRIDWELKQSDLEAVVGTHIEDIRLVGGTARPCRRLPIVILGKNEEDQQRPLWTIDTQSGRLDGPYAIPWEYDPCIIPTLPPTVKIQASSDGRFVVYGRDRPRSKDEIIVFDTRAKRLVARRISPSWEYSVRFDSSGRVLIEGEQGVIYSWRHPDAGAFDVLFALKSAGCRDPARGTELE